MISAPAKALNFCHISDPNHFNPAYDVEHLADRSWARVLFDRMVEFGPQGIGIVPGLAESWEISRTGKTYRFNLRKDVMFHSNTDFTPSRPLSVEDVIFTFERLRDIEHPLHLTIETERYSEFIRSPLYNYLEWVRKIDESTVEFRFSTADAGILADFAKDFSSILSAEYGELRTYQGEYELFDRMPIGTGPFRLTAYFKDNLINLRHFERSWQALTGDSNLILTPIAREKDRVAGLLNGKCNVIPDLSIESVQSLSEVQWVNLIKRHTNQVTYIAYNTQWPPTNKLEIRQGLSMATNREFIQRAVFKNMASIANSPIPVGVWGHHEALPTYAYSPTAAKEKFSAANVDRFKLTLWVQNEPNALIPDPVLLSEALAADWSLASVDVKVKLVDESELLRQAANPERDGAIVLNARSLNGVPEDFLNALLRCGSDSGRNYAHWCNSIYERLMQAADEENQLDIRMEYYERAQEIFYEQVPWTPLVYHFTYVAMGNNVKDFEVSPNGYYDFYGVSLERR